MPLISREISLEYSHLRWLKTAKPPRLVGQRRFRKYRLLRERDLGDGERWKSSDFLQLVSLISNPKWREKADAEVSTSATYSHAHSDNLSAIVDILIPYDVILS